MKVEADMDARRVSELVKAIRARLPPDHAVCDVVNDVVNREVVFRSRKGNDQTLAYAKFLALYAKPN